LSGAEAGLALLLALWLVACGDETVTTKDALDTAGSDAVLDSLEVDIPENDTTDVAPEVSPEVSQEVTPEVTPDVPLYEAMEVTSGCGDGSLELGEACDDGNRINGDGCSMDCARVESGYVCPVAGSRCISATCGNGVLETPREQCDDGLNDGSYGTCGPDCFLASHKRPATTVRTTAGTAAADPTASPIRTAAMG